MPRKKNTEKNFNAKKNQEELDSLFKNLNKSEQNEANEEETLEEHEEESELEEDVDDSSLNLQALQFHQFMLLNQREETGAPVLERIAGNQGRPIFVGGIPQGVSAAGEESRDEFKYVPGAADANEPKYFAEPGIENAPERLDLTRAGRTDNFREEINQERFFMQSEPRMESQTPERFERAERFDVEKAGRRDVFERPEAKYEKYRPKLPKS